MRTILITLALVCASTAGLAAQQAPRRVTIPARASRELSLAAPRADRNGSHGTRLGSSSRVLPLQVRKQKPQAAAGRR